MAISTEKGTSCRNTTETSAGIQSYKTLIDCRTTAVKSCSFTLTAAEQTLYDNMGDIKDANPAKCVTKYDAFSQAFQVSIGLGYHGFT